MSEDVVNVSRLREQLIALTARATRAATQVAARITTQLVNSGRVLMLALPSGVPRGETHDIRIRMAARHAAMAALGGHPLEARIHQHAVQVSFPGSMRAPSASQMADFQYAFQRQLTRDFPGVDVTPDRAVAQDLAGRAIGKLQELLKGDPVDTAWPAASAGLAVSQAEQASGLRPAPVQPDKTVFLDTMSFTVKTEGLEPLSLTQRDHVLREMLARAAGLTDPGQLNVLTRPLASEGKHNGEHAVFVMLNSRNSAQRTPDQANPSRIRDLMLQNAPNMSGGTALAGGPVGVKIKAIQIGVQVATAAARAVPAVLQDLQQRSQAEITR